MKTFNDKKGLGLDVFTLFVGTIPNMSPALLLALVTVSPGSLIQAEGPLLLQHPTVNATDVAFAFAGDLWSVPRTGGDARRLTASAGQESNPYYSPDGKWIAFSGQYDGNLDVYVMPSEGGVPKRLTFHPSGENVLGWSPDGKRVLYSGNEESMPFNPRLFTVSVSGGKAEDLPFPTGSMGCFSPDGTQIAYVPYFQFQAAWKRYRGGQTYPVWIAKLSDSTYKEVSRRNSNDTYPLWIGNRIYFISDRAGKKHLYSSDLNGGGVREHAKSGEFDFLTATAGPGVIALGEFGAIKLFDVATGRVSEVKVNVRGDFPEVRTKYVPFADFISGGDVSPNGKRVALEGRGEIFTLPASKGDPRNLSESSGSAERSPAWSPDGKWIAFLSDDPGEYKIVLNPSDGVGDKRILHPGDGSAFYSGLVWSPDSKKLAYVDNKAKVWYTDVESGKATQVDEAPLLNVFYGMSPVWSPDSKWLAYTRQGDNFLRGVYLYSLETAKSTPLTDGLSEAHSPVFDQNGKYLYFIASTNARNTPGWLDLSSLDVPNVTGSVYVAILRKGLPSPFLPESDEEPVGGKKEEEKKEDFRIDFDGIRQRILTVPMPGRNYQGLLTGPAGSFFAADIPAVFFSGQNPGPATLRKFTLDARQEAVFAAGVQGAAVSSNGQFMLLFGAGGVRIVSTAAPPPPGMGTLNLGSAVLRVEPKKEWRQMFEETIRIQRDYFYDPNYHGVDLKALRAKYLPFIDGLMSRADLNTLFTDMLGELCVGHMYVGGGDIPGVSGPPIGMLGADYSIESGRYRFKKVYTGENWNPGLIGPLSAPGVEVKAGEFLIEVNGKELKGDESVYERFVGLAGRQVRLKVGPNANGSGSREVTVVPTANENSLRIMDWVEGNRRKVEELSGGRVGYTWIPNTSVQGYTYFNRYYFSQVNRDGFVLDERSNGGGFVDDYFINVVNRPIFSWWATRYGKTFGSPLMSIYGPKAMIADQYAGSGGDYLPWAFKRAKLGPVVGKRTWGGLVGILGFPSLIDGGSVTSPNLAFFSPEGAWEIENYGTPPDIEVEMDPVLWRQGRDAQLERAVAEVMKQLQNYRKPTPKLPPYKDNTKIGG